MPKTTRDEFLKVKTKTATVEVPDLGTVVVRQLTAGEVLQFGKLEQAEDASRLSYLIKTATVDDTGSPIFTDADSDMINKLPFPVSQPIVMAIRELSGLNQTVTEKK